MSMRINVAGLVSYTHPQNSLSLYQQNEQVQLPDIYFLICLATRAIET